MHRDSFRLPVTLEGTHVRLVPLGREHAEGLVRAAQDPEVSRYLRSPLPTRTEDMARLIAHRLELARAEMLLPFVTTLTASGRVVGTTNFARPDLANETVEIGGTWIDRAFWHTAVNTEAKLLMLEFAFDRAGAHKVYLQTDARNSRSRTAIAALGAQEETVFREDVHLGDGRYRTSIYFGILASEWATVRSRLRRRLTEPWASRVEANAPTQSSDAPAPARPFRLEPPEANPTALREPPVLTGRYVTLVPLARDHVPGLAIAGRHPEVWRFLRIGPAQDLASMTTLVDGMLARRDEGSVQPFAIFFNPEQRPVGIVRYLDIDRQNNQVELGTWVDPALWRTPVNTELKYLALRHAFEIEAIHRVQLRTDSRNTRSQAAIERLGSVREGVLREYILRPDGYRRSSVCYSILADEWPKVKAGLEQKLARPWTPSVPRTMAPSG